MTLALAATSLSQQYHIPVMLLALVTGIAFNFLCDDSRFSPGILFASKSVLRVGVALLGLQVSAKKILGLGLMPIAIVVIGLSTTIAFGIIVARLLRLRATFGILSSGSVAICGASAALAIASVLPRSAESDGDLIFTIVSVTALSTGAMILYPMVAALLHLSNGAAGIFLGGSIHDVAQVVGAGYTISPETGDIATYVKLLRVLLLVPVVCAISASHGRNRSHTSNKLRVPLFLVGFIALVITASTIAMPSALLSKASDVSRWCLATAIAALGMRTSVQTLAAAGWRPLALIVGETLWIGAVVLASIFTGGKSGHI
jgi:uncharacterized integral membrane protein (TIGR00698 family)